MTDNRQNRTLLTGQLLQIRDKVMAKRHLIPAQCQNEWHEVQTQTAVFDPDGSGQLVHLNTRSGVKHSSFKGSINELMALVTTLQHINSQIKTSAH